MILRILLVVTLFLNALSDILSQEDSKPLPQIVELKDGSKLLGTLISDTDYAIQMVILTGDTIEIGYKYISSVGAKKDSRIQRVLPRKIKLPIKHVSKTFITNISIGGSSQGNDEDAGLIVNTSLMKMLNDKVGIGIGTGYMTYNKPVSFYDINTGFVPIYATTRYVLPQNTDSKPFVQLAAGYAIGINRQRFDFQSEYITENGLFGQAQLGITIANRRSYNLSIALSLNIQKTKGVLSGLDWNTNQPFSSSFDLVMVRPGLSIGVLF